MRHKPDRKTDISSKVLSENKLSVLAKGPKFCITPRITDRTVDEVRSDLAVMAYTYRWSEQISKDATTEAISEPPTCRPLQRRIPFRKAFIRAPDLCKLSTGIKLRQLEPRVLRIIETAKQKKYIKNNLTSGERIAITKLAQDESIVIERSDKEGEFAVLSNDQYIKMCNDHLNDPTVYRKLKTNPTNQILTRMNRTIKAIGKARDIAPSFINTLCASHCKTQKFYCLPKTHKSILKPRPIVSGCGSPFDRISWLLQEIIKPLIAHVPAHLENPAQLLDEYQKADAEKELTGNIPVSLEVFFLYTKCVGSGGCRYRQQLHR